MIRRPLQHMDTAVQKQMHTNCHLCPNRLFDMFNSVAPLLKAVMIPEGHIWLLLNKNNVVLLKNMVYMVATVATLTKLRAPTNGNRSPNLCTHSSELHFRWDLRCNVVRHCSRLNPKFCREWCTRSLRLH